MSQETITYTIVGKPAKVEFVNDPSLPGWNDIKVPKWKGIHVPVEEEEIQAAGAVRTSAQPGTCGDGPSESPVDRSGSASGCRRPTPTASS